MWWLWPKFLSENDLQILPFGCVYLHLTDITRYRLIHHPDQHSIFCYFPWNVRPKSEDPAMGSWLHQVTVLWVANWPEFLPKIFIHGPYFEEPSCILCFLVCFIIRDNRFTTFLLLMYFPLSLVKTKGQIEIVYVDELRRCHCHCPKL